MIIAAVLASALLHALWNAFLRSRADKDGASLVVIALATVVAAVVAAIGTLRGVTAFPTASSFGWSLAAGVCEAGYLFALVRGLSAGPLGPVYTTSRGGAIVLVWPISILAFAEPVGSASVAGSALVLAGLAAIGLARQTTRASLAWGAACAVCIAAYHLMYKVALADGGSAPAVFAVSLAMATPVNAFRMRHRLGAIARAAAAAPLHWIAAGAICAGSFLLFLIALRGGGAGAVLTLRNTSVLFATALGYAIGDRPTRAQWLGAILVAVGAALLSLGS